jgi:hypothetical protein
VHTLCARTRISVVATAALCVLVVGALSACTGEKKTKPPANAECSQAAPTPAPTANSSSNTNAGGSAAANSNTRDLLNFGGPAPLTSSEGATWGPPRPTFTSCSRAGYTTLDSIVNSTSDERNFIGVKPAGKSDNDWQWRTITLTPGHKYTAQIFFWNSASTKVPSATSEDARAYLRLPTWLNGTGTAGADLSAANASPEKIWSSIVLRLKDPNASVVLDPVAGSARLQVGGNANGSTISLADLQSPAGAQIGCDQLDGQLDGSTRCQGHVYVDFTVKNPPFTLRDYPWEGQSVPTVESTPGSALSLVSEVKNVTSSPLEDVWVEEQRSAGISLNSNLVWTRKTLANGTQENWQKLTATWSSDHTYFTAEIVGDTALLPGEAEEIFFNTTVASTGEWACGGEWIPLTTFAWDPQLRLKTLLTVDDRTVC